MPSPRDDGASSDLPAALHEVSNALTVVVGWIDLALAALPPGGPAAEALEVARGRAARAQRLARRAIGAERDVDPPRALDAVVDEVARGLERARSGGVRIDVDIAPALRSSLLQRGDAAGQVLTNIVLNAVEASNPGGVVRIDARPEQPGFVLVTVSDDGPGVPETLRGALFTGGRSSRPGGAGIGLRHAAVLALDVGGAVGLAPDRDGAPGAELAGAHAPAGPGEGHRERAGAVFEVRWPLVEGTSPSDDADTASPDAAPSWPPGVAPADVEGPVSSSGRLRLDGVRLLVVEDDAAVVDLLEAALAARGASIEVARDRAALSAALALPPYDAALVDLSPLGGDVLAALRDLRAHSATARVVVISGSTRSTTDVPHVDAWVRKPFEIRDVVEALCALR